MPSFQDPPFKLIYSDFILLNAVTLTNSQMVLDMYFLGSYYRISTINDNEKLRWAESSKDKIKGWNIGQDTERPVFSADIKA